VPSRAADNFVPIVMSIFQGGCYTVDSRGKSLGKLAADKPGWKTFEVRPFARNVADKYSGAWDERAGYFNVRNPAAYGALVDPATRPPWTQVFLSQTGQAQTRDQVLKPADGAELENRDWISKGLGQEGKLALPSFTDDLAVRIECTQPAKRTTVPGTQ
jgi:hypothetical protein